MSTRGKWRRNARKRGLDDGMRSHFYGSRSDRAQPGNLYAVRRGDSLLGIVRDAFPFLAPLQRLHIARQMNASQLYPRDTGTFGVFLMPTQADVDAEVASAVQSEDPRAVTPGSR